MKEYPAPFSTEIMLVKKWKGSSLCAAAYYYAGNMLIGWRLQREICADADMMLLCRFFIFVHTFVWKDSSKVVVVVMEWECLLLSFSL